MPKTYKDLIRIVIGVDPAVSAGEDADETGIIVAGLGVDRCGYVLADLSCSLSPNDWAKRVVGAYHEYGADRIIAEVNQGGALVESVLRTVDRHIPLRCVHAAKAKAIRAEPIAALYEQGRVFHVAQFAKLEDQMLNYVPGEPGQSPDRLDALVWAMTELMIDRNPNAVEPTRRARLNYAIPLEERTFGH